MSNLGKIRDFICTEFVSDMNADEIPRDLDLIEAGIIDSLGILKIVAFLEEEYNINILTDEMEADKYRSLDAIGAFIEAKRNAELVGA